MAFLMIYYISLELYGPIDIDSVNLRNYKSAFTATFVLFLFVFSFTHFSYYLVKFIWKKYRILLFSILFIFSFYLLKLFFTIYNSCNTWD